MPAVLENNRLYPNLYRRMERLMGNRFEFTLLADGYQHAAAGMEMAVAEVRRIERLLTTFNEDSQTNLVNRLAGIRPAPVDREFLELVKRSLAISQLTQGAFDITYGSIDKRLWNFDTSMTSLPDAVTAKKSVSLINYRNVILDETACTVFLAEKGMRIGFGGIGKGYAAECARRLMQVLGAKNGIVNAAGDLVAWGHRPDGQPWTIGIVDPDHSDRVVASVHASGLAVATSGEYEKYAVVDGKKYSHTIDPRTGLPISGIKSATIICPNAELADALTTPVMIMGIRAGMNLINQMKNIGCILIDEENRLHVSSNIHLHEEILRCA